MEIDSETVSSTPSAVWRETTIDPVNLVDPFDPVSPADFPRDIAVSHKRPAWARHTLQEEEGHAAPRVTFQERKRPQIFSIYVSSMRHIIDIEPYFHGEAIGQQVWQDAMTEEY
jgi:hypothetical protein